MAQLTGGTVSFKRQFQPEQYGSRGAEVVLTFLIAEGEGAAAGKDMLDLAGRLAQDKVMELVYAKPIAKGLTLAETLRPAPTTSLTPVPTLEQAKAILATPPSLAAAGVLQQHEKASPAVEAIAAAVVVADKVEGKEQAAAKLNAKDAAMKKKLAKVAEKVGAVPAAQVMAIMAEDPFADAPAVNPKVNISTGEERVDPAFEAPVPTPKEVSDAITKRMTSHNDPKVIQEVISRYVTRPKTFRDIPVEQRAEFLAAILALK